MTGNLFEDRGATFSPCGTWRYALWRRWDERPRLRLTALFVMLNPSTADETANDPTVERCERRCRALGFGGFEVCNLFALRSTDPKALYRAEDPVGPETDAHIAAAIARTDIVICGWGTHAARVRPGRTADVVALIRDCGRMPFVLEVNADGSPKHPLYVGYGTQPRPWEA